MTVGDAHPTQDREIFGANISIWNTIDPECYAVEESSNSFILAEHNCAISEVAASFPSVCGHELEMFSFLLPDCKIERTHWLIGGEHRCGYLITSHSGV